MDSDAEKLLELLDSYAGVLPFSEKGKPGGNQEKQDLAKMHSSVQLVIYIRKERLISQMAKSVARNNSLFNKF